MLLFRNGRHVMCKCAAGLSSAVMRAFRVGESAGNGDGCFCVFAQGSPLSSLAPCTARLMNRLLQDDCGIFPFGRSNTNS